MKKTVIYYNFKTNNDKYIVSFSAGKKMVIKPLDDEKTFYTEEEKEIIKEYTRNNPKFASYLDTMEIWIECTRDDSSTMSGIKLAAVVEEMNKDNDANQDKDNVTYFIFDYFKKVWKKVRSDVDKEIIETDIASKDLKIIEQSDDELSRDDIIKIIEDSRVASANIYVAMYCPKCQKYTTFVVKSSVSSVGRCSLCHQESEIINPIYQGLNLYDANVAANRENEGKKEKDNENINQGVVFHYLGKPYSSFIDKQKDLHDQIYLHKDGKAIFENKEGKIVFKDIYKKYVSSFNPSLIEEAEYQLDSLFYDIGEDYIDEDVALYWYYNSFPLGSKFLKDKHSIFIKGEEFHNVDEFINKFVSSNEEKQKFYSSLLNAVYIKYFFLDEDGNPIFISNTIDKYITLSKIIFQKSKNYIFIDMMNHRIHNFGKRFLDDLIKDDNLNHLRYEFLNLISYESKDFKIPGDFYYSAVMDDCYDYNCYVYSLFRNNGYYYFRDLKLPIDNKCIHVINKIIQDKYFGFKSVDDSFEDLVFLYKNKILNADLTAQINVSVEEGLRGLNLDNYDNILELYIRSKSDMFRGDIEFFYNGELATLTNHVKKAFDDGHLIDIAKDKQMDVITNLLFKDDKKTIVDNAEKTFKAMNEKIDQLIKESEK